MDTTTGEACPRQLTGCDLLDRCVSRRHDEDWREFTRRYGPMVRKWVCRKLARLGLFSLEEVEETVQCFYVRLLSGGASFRGSTEAQLRSYLGRVVWNLIADRHRRGRSGRRQDARVPLPWWMAREPPSPEQRAMARQLLVQFLERCRATVSGARAELKLRVVRLAFLSGYSSGEIAERLSGEVTARQVDSMIFRLRRELAQKGIEVPHRLRARPPGRTGSHPPALRSSEAFVHQ